MFTLYIRICNAILSSHTFLLTHIDSKTINTLISVVILHKTMDESKMIYAVKYQVNVQDVCTEISVDPMIYSHNGFMSLVQKEDVIK